MDCFGNTLDNYHIGDVKITESLTVLGTTEIAGEITATTLDVLGNTTINGNLEVKGSIISKDELIITDPLFEINSEAVNNVNNIGYFGKYISSGTKYTGFLKDATSQRYKLFDSETILPTSTTSTWANLGSLDLLDAKAETLEATTSLTTPLINDITISIRANNVEQIALSQSSLSMGIVVPTTNFNLTITNTASFAQLVNNFISAGHQFDVLQTITVRELGVETIIARTNPTFPNNSYTITLWRHSDQAILRQITATNLSPIKNGCYFEPIEPIILTPDRYTITCIFPSQSTGRYSAIFTSSGNCTTNNPAIFTIIGAVKSNGNATEVPVYPTTYLFGPSNTNACQFIYGDDEIGLNISNDKLTLGGETILNTTLEVKGNVKNVITEDMAPLLTDTHSIGTGSLRYLDSEIKIMNTTSIRADNIEQIALSGTSLGLGSVEDALNQGIVMANLDTEQSPYALWQIYGINLVPTVDITITHLGFHELLPGTSGKTNFYCRIWSNALVALTPALEVKTSDTKINGFYYAELLTPIEVKAGEAIRTACIVPGLSVLPGCNSFDGFGNITANPDITYGVLCRGNSSQYATEELAYDTAPYIDTAQNFIRAGGMLYSKGTNPAINLDTIITTNLNIVPRLTDTNSIGTASLRYLDSEIKTMNSTELYFNASSDNKIWFPTTSGSNIGLQITDWTSQAFTDYARNGTHPSGLITHHIATDFNISSIQKLSIASAKILAGPPVYNLGDRYAGTGAPSIVNLYSATATTSVIGTLLNTDYSITSEVFAGTKTIKANTIRAGDSIRCKTAGIMSWQANDSATFWIKLGTTKMVQTSSVSFPATTGGGWDMVAVLTFHTNSGVSVNVGSFISFHFNDDSLSRQGKEEAYITSVDTTTDLVISMGVRFDQTQTLDGLITVIGEYDYVGRV